MKTVVMILPEFGFGGAERSFCALSMELAKYYHIKVIVFNLQKAPNYPIGGEVVSLDIVHSNHSLIKLTNLFRKVSRLKQIKKQINPAASISFLEGANYINILSSVKEKVIISVRTSKLFDHRLSKLNGFVRKKVLIPWLYKKAGKIVAVGEGIRNELSSTYSSLNESDIKTIYNFIDNEKISSLANDPLTEEWLMFFEKHKVLVTSGRLAAEKGLHYFLQVFAQLAKEIDDIRLLIIGEGEHNTKLHKLCLRLKLTSDDCPGDDMVNGKAKVCFLGYKPNPFKFIKRAQLYISSSTHEGFGNSILEALSCGTTVTASDCPYGPREILTETVYDGSGLDYPFYGKYGILLPNLESMREDSKTIWRDTISDLLNDSSRLNKYSEISHDRAAFFTRHRSIAKWKSIIE